MLGLPERQITCKDRKSLNHSYAEIEKPSTIEKPDNSRNQGLNLKPKNHQTDYLNKIENDKQIVLEAAKQINLKKKSQKLKAMKRKNLSKKLLLKKQFNKGN